MKTLKVLVLLLFVSERKNQKQMWKLDFGSQI